MSRMTTEPTPNPATDPPAGTPAANPDGPLIGVTADLHEGRVRVNRTYIDQVLAAGGIPLVLAPTPDACLVRYLQICDGFVLTGGDDPVMEPFGAPTDPRVTRVEPARQAFETALLAALDTQPDTPVLGVCLGMQMMGLCAGAGLDQYLPESLATADLHWEHRDHEVAGPLGSGVVHSHHKQALSDAGRLEVAATSPDGVIEAVHDPARRWYVGVQWHPERTSTPALGSGLFERLVAAARGE